MNEKTRLILPLTLLSITAASLGGAAIVSLFLATKPVAVLVIGAFAMPAFFYLSGNPRLSTFWCMILSAPFSFGKDFMIVGHMGGAGAYTIELVDIFIVMMLVFIGRDFLLGYRRQIKLSWVVFYFGGCIALGLLTMAMGPYRNVAGHEVVRMLKGLLFFLVLVNELERPRQFLHVVGALMLGISLQSSVALVQFIKRGSLGLQVLGEAGDETLDYASQATYTGADTVFRVGGLLGHPTLLATFLYMLAPIGLELM